MARIFGSSFTGQPAQRLPGHGIYLPVSRTRLKSILEVEFVARKPRTAYPNDFYQGLR
jgi:hypothetical protein